MPVNLPFTTYDENRQNEVLGVKNPNRKRVKMFFKYLHFVQKKSLKKVKIDENLKRKKL